MRVRPGAECEHNSKTPMVGRKAFRGLRGRVLRGSFGSAFALVCRCGGPARFHFMKQNGPARTWCRARVCSSAGAKALSIGSLRLCACRAYAHFDTCVAFPWQDRRIRSVADSMPRKKQRSQAQVDSTQGASAARSALAAQRRESAGQVHRDRARARVHVCVRVRVRVHVRVGV